MQLGDGSSVSTVGRCAVRVHIQSHASTPSFHLLDTLPGDYDAVLGDDWLHQHEARLDFKGSGKCTVQKGSGRITLLPISAESPAVLNTAHVFAEELYALDIRKFVMTLPVCTLPDGSRHALLLRDGGDKLSWLKGKVQVFDTDSRAAASRVTFEGAQLDVDPQEMVVVGHETDPVHGSTAVFTVQLCRTVLPRVKQAEWLPLVDAIKKMFVPGALSCDDTGESVRQLLSTQFSTEWRDALGVDATTPSSVPLLSALQLKRAVRQADRTFMVMVSAVSGDTGLPQVATETDVAVPGLQGVLDEYKDVFSPMPEGLPPARGVGHTIPLEPGTIPPFKAMFRLSPKEKLEVEKQVSELLAKGWIEPSISPYGAPILFVQKKDGTLRMCIDYRALNKQTVKNRYPLPRIDDLLDQLHGSCVFTSLDLQSGYHQIRITDDDVEKTAFRTHRGLYQFRVLPFGLSNAPSTFQAAMNAVLGPVLGKFCLVYMDDILIFSKSAAEHAEHVRSVLQLLRENKFYCKLSKCTFGKAETEFLGHVISKEGIKADPRKIAAIMNWPVPKDVSGVRSFLGMATYFRKFCPHFSSRAHHLHVLTRGNQTSIVWTPECQRAFDDIKQALSTAPVLAVPDLSSDASPFEVICDASQVGLGAVLTQDGRAVAYESRKLNKSELNYHPGELELLGVVHAMRTWRCYLEGVKSIVVTDHNPLVYLQTQPNLSRKQARWSQYLQMFNFEWKYRPGKTNPADPLSRVPAFALACALFLPMQLRTSRRVTQKVAENQAAATVGRQPRSRAVGGTTRKRKRGAQEAAPASDAGAAPVLPLLLQRCREGYRSDPWFADEKHVAGLQKTDGLYKQGGQVVVPDVDTLRVEILKEIHDTPFGGHAGRARTFEQLTRLFWWPHVRDDVNTYVDTCHSCQRNKGGSQKPAGLMQSLQVPGRRWGSVGLDFITALPKTASGHTQIAVFICRLTKMVHFVPLKEDASARDVARCFVHNVFRLHGLPADLVTDRDSKFTSAFWAECMRILGTARHMSTAFHPQSDGQTERTNIVLEDMLRHFVSPCQDDWDELLDCAEFAANNAYSASVQNTPFRLNYGQDPLTPMSIEAQTNIPAARDFVHGMHESLKAAKRAMQAAQDRQKAHYDKGHRHQEFKVGDKVFLRSRNLTFKGDVVRKLLPKWVGPFEVVHRVGKLAYKLQLPETMSRVHPVFHTGLLKLFKDDGRHQPPPQPVVVDGAVMFPVEAIVSHKKGRGGKVKFLVKWEGLGTEQNSWEPEANLAGAPDVVAAYWDKVNAA